MQLTKFITLVTCAAVLSCSASASLEENATNTSMGMNSSLGTNSTINGTVSGVNSSSVATFQLADDSRQA